jgi:hypothetical protein
VSAKPAKSYSEPKAIPHRRISELAGQAYPHSLELQHLTGTLRHAINQPNTPKNQYTAMSIQPLVTFKAGQCELTVHAAHAISGNDQG